MSRMEARIVESRRLDLLFTVAKCLRSQVVEARRKRVRVWQIFTSERNREVGNKEFEGDVGRWWWINFHAKRDRDRVRWFGETQETKNRKKSCREGMCSQSIDSPHPMRAWASESLNSAATSSAVGGHFSFMIARDVTHSIWFARFLCAGLIVPLQISQFQTSAKVEKRSAFMKQRSTELRYGSNWFQLTSIETWLK